MKDTLASATGEGSEHAVRSTTVEYTPGPWTVDDPMYTKVFAGNMTVCDIRGWGYLTGIGGLRLPDEKAIEIQKANARLIAAAPDLFEACLFVKAFLGKLEGNDIYDPLYLMRQRFHAPLHAKLDAAIAKAQGALDERTACPDLADSPHSTQKGTL